MKRSLVFFTVLVLSAPLMAGAEDYSWLPQSSLDISLPDLDGEAVLVFDSTPLEILDGNTDELVEETFGSWDMIYNASNVSKGNLFLVDSTVNLHEHRFHLDFTTAQPLCFYVYQGVTLEGLYTLVDSVTVGNQGPGNDFFSSGVRNFELTSGYYYYIGVAWGAVTCNYARANGPTPPIPCSFGSLQWGVGYCYTGFPPAPTVTYRVTQYTAYHQTIVTGSPGLPDLVVTLNPHNPPIQIPAGGGSFTFDASIENTTNGAITFDAWIMVTLPNGIPYGPLLRRSGLPIPGGATIMRTLTQNVPQVAPPGEYTLVGNAGFYPDSVIDSDSFNFTKNAGDNPPNHRNGWAVYGWDEPYDDVSQMIPSEAPVLNAFPNPFNPSTAISFQLQAASNVKLAVYDIAGREVGVLAEGWMPAGKHQVEWYASDQPSGVYFARLKAGSRSQTQKLLLLK